MAIHAAPEAKKKEDANHGRRQRVLVPSSAHGTNPATAAFLGFEVQTIRVDKRGCVPVEAVREALAQAPGEIAAMMITNPNTCGLLEEDMVSIAHALHEAGAYVYCDGANFNAFVGKIQPGALGADAMHINLHKTFSTPHGGGGPGSGPVVFSKKLAPFAPLPTVWKKGDHWEVVEHPTGEEVGRIGAFFGQMGMFVRAVAYMMSHGQDGLAQVSEDCVLSANYIRARLKDTMSMPFPKRCMHEVLFDDTFLEGTGLDTLSFAKALIDEGYHPMTIYFPLVVKGALLVEPTETESLKS